MYRTSFFLIKKFLDRKLIDRILDDTKNVERKNCLGFLLFASNVETFLSTKALLQVLKVVMAINSISNELSLSFYLI